MVFIFQIQMVRVSCLAAGIRAGVLAAEVDQGQQRGCGRWTANGKVIAGCLLHPLSHCGI